MCIRDSAKSARQLVGRTAGGEGDDERHGLLRVLGLGKERQGEQGAHRRDAASPAGAEGRIHGASLRSRFGGSRMSASVPTRWWRKSSGTSIGRSSNRKARALPWLSRLSASLTPPSSTSSR